ncbi:hypothetical protein AYK26_07260 [Euryarchaeota archaeon SM23-78]|nr:MAG: hypothetical protein AYK26_07260 [Euryarchaeota archaeon SM23-78]
MNYKESLEELEKNRNELLSYLDEIDEKLIKEEIDGIEYHILLNEKLEGKTKEEALLEIEEEITELEEEYKQHKKKKTELAIAGAMLLAFVLISIFSQIPLESPTGFVIGEKQETHRIAYNRVFEQNAENVLDLTNITSLRISGELEGTRASIKLRVGEKEYLVTEITLPEQENLITGLAIAEPEPEYTISTDKAEYALGETVYISVEPETENKSIYVEDGEQRHKLEENTYITQKTGEHQVIALIVLPNDILRLETSFTVTNASIDLTTNETLNETLNQTINETINERVEPEPVEPIEPLPETPQGYEFSELCIETCTLPETSYPTLIIEVDQGSKLTITKLIVTQTKENQAPRQTQIVPDLVVLTSQPTVLDLDEYFADPDQDTLVYDINEIPEIGLDIQASTLTLNSDMPGIYMAYLYATDGDKLTTSNTFHITVTQEGVEQPTTPLPEPSTTPSTPTQPEVIDPCKHPNPNERPIECLEGNEEEYFRDKSIHLKNLDRKPIARVTAFGNLIIKGSLIENSDENPGSNDFRISYSLPDEGTEVATAWIDTSTGDLHLRGKLYEEQFDLVPGGDAFIIQNRKGTNLGYFDRRTGDLYLRGNLIQEREEQDIIES